MAITKTKPLNNNWGKRKHFVQINLYFFFLAARAFSSYSEQRLLFVVVHGFLIAVASLVVEHGL